jgi:hypothetical protein
MTFPLALAGRALVDPTVGVPASVEGKKWLLPLILVVLASTFSGVTYALKLDVARQVIPGMAKKGDMSKVSEREISDEVQQAQRIALVTGTAKGVAGVPLALLALALFLKLVGWIFQKKVPFSAAFTVAAVAMLPIAVYNLVYATSLWQQDFVTVESARKLVPTSLTALSQFADAQGAMKRVWGAVDFFNLWSALLLGLGLGRAMGIKAWKGVVLGLVLYVMFAAVFLVGLPGLAENFGPGAGGPGGGRGGPR